MAEIASLFATIGADTSGFKRGMATVDSSLNSAGGRISGFNRLLQTGMVAAAGAAVAGIAALGAAITKGVGAAASMEQSLANIRADLGLTAEEAGRAGQLISQLGLDPNLKVTAEEAASAIHMLGKNGLSLTQIMDGAARSTVLLANSTGADFATAADIATDVMAQFKIEAKDMAGVVDQIAGVTQNSKFNINDYRLAIAQAGGVAASVGVEFDDFNATIAAISPLFASGSDAGTSFKTFLQRLVPASSDAAEQMSKLGLTTVNATAATQYLASKGISPLSNNMWDLYNQVVDAFHATNNLEVGSEEAAQKFKKFAAETGLVQSAFFDANGQMKEMSEISAILGKSFDGLSEAQKIEAASTIFGTDAMRAAFAIADAGAGTFEKLKAAIGDTDAEEAAAIRMDTLIGQWEIFTGIIGEYTTQIGQKFKDNLKEIVKQFTALANKYGPGVVDFFGKIAQIMPSASQAGEFFANVFDTVGTVVSWVAPKAIGLLSQIGKTVLVLSKYIGEASKSGDWLNGWLGHLPRPLQIVTKGLVGLANVARAISRPLSAIAQNVKLMFMGLGEGNLGIFTSGLRGAMMDIQRFVYNATGALGGVNFGQKLANWTRVFVTWASAIWGTVSPFLRAFARDFINWITSPSVVNAAKSAITTGWNMFADWAGTVWSYMQPKLVQAWNYLTSWVTDPTKRQTLMAALADGWNAFTGWAGAVWSSYLQPGLANAWSSLSSWITDPGKRQTIFSALSTGWNAFTDWAQAVWSSYLQPGLSAAWENLTSWVTEPTKRQAILTGLTNTWNGFIDWAGAVWSDYLQPGLSDAWDSLTSWITDPTKRSALFKSIGDTWKGFTDWAGTLWIGSILPGVSMAWQSLISWVTDSAKRQQLFNMLSYSWASFVDWAGAVWTRILPVLQGMYNSLIKWIDEQSPGLGTKLDNWRKSFVDFVVGAKNAFNENFPEIKRITQENGASIIGDIGKIVGALSELFTFPSTEGPGAIGDYAKMFTAIYDITAKVAAGVTKIVSSMIQSFALLKRSINAVGSGDLGQFKDITNQLNNIMSSMQGTIIEDIAKYIDPLYWLGIRPDSLPQPQMGVDGGFASGGFVPKTGRYLVGEKGPEIVDMPASARVRNNVETGRIMAERMANTTTFSTAPPAEILPPALSAGAPGQPTGQSRIDIYVHGESALPTDRGKLRELAIALQRELAFTGARVVVA